MESLRGISNQKYLIFLVLDHIWFKKNQILAILAEWLYSGYLANLLISIKLWANSWSSTSVFGHFRLYFSVYWVGAVSELCLRYTDVITNPKTVNWPQLLSRVWSLPDWEAVWSSLVCMPWVCLLCQHMCQCASMPEVCQHTRGSSQKCLSFPEVPEGPRCPEGQDVVPLCQMAQNPQDCTYGIIFTWSDDICIVLPLMWWPIGCGYCQNVCSLHRLVVKSFDMY